MSTRYFKELPKPYMAYAKILYTLVRKPAKMEKKLPQAEYVVSALHIDREHLAKYNAICGFTQQGILPPTYLAVLSQALQMRMMTEEAFPFPVVGLVHIRNTITQMRSIKNNEILGLSCKFGALTPHDKGLQFDFITSAVANGTEVWHGVTTYLVRQKTADSEQKAPAVVKEAVVYDKDAIQTQWSIPDDIGRRYAPISGDYNPIHIHPLTAKLLGFPRTIAHGMWTKARCLAELGHLPEHYAVDVHFKLPVLLPAKVDFKAQSGKAAIFELSETGSGKPHIYGTINTLS